MRGPSIRFASPGTTVPCQPETFFAELIHRARITSCCSRARSPSRRYPSQIFPKALKGSRRSADFPACRIADFLVGCDAESGKMSRDQTNPKGFRPGAQGLRRMSYPGYAWWKYCQPQRGCASADANKTQPRLGLIPHGGFPRVARLPRRSVFAKGVPRKPWADRRNPVRIGNTAATKESFFHGTAGRLVSLLRSSPRFDGHGL